MPKRIVQNVKRKNKGRPSKADFARHNGEPELSSVAAQERDLRRSNRCRNVLYTLDWDDYIDEDDEDDVKREKKLDLLLKLEDKEKSSSQLVTHETTTPPPPSSDYGDDCKPLKKRRIHRDDKNADIDQNKDQLGKPPQDQASSVPGRPSNSPSGVPLPDKQTLEQLLDKLQKKDVYGVYAEPVEPDELPNYHDVIKNPMDFGTVRRKLGNGKYSTLEQFESDVFLICENAMTYNAPDTIYYKQAYSIQEMAKQKFERLKSETEYSSKELKVEQMPKKQIKKSMNRIMLHEPIGSDFSSALTIPTRIDTRKTPRAPQAVASEKPAILDGFVEPNVPSVEICLDKGKKLPPGKTLLYKRGRKPPVHEEKRCATYQLSAKPTAIPESIFTTSEDGIKQLVPVGLNADHSYARSLARFAATLGSAAWQVAARKIEQALPPELKFGRGWVGEYETLTTSVLQLENRIPKEPARSQCNNDVKKDEKVVSTKKYPLTSNHLEGKSLLFGQIRSQTTTTSTNCALPAKENPFKFGTTKEEPTQLCSPRSRPTNSASVSYQVQNLPARDSVESGKKVLNSVELNSTPSPNQNQADSATHRQISSRQEVPDSRNRDLPNSVSFTQRNNEAVAMGVPKEKGSTNNLDRNRMVLSSMDNLIYPMASTSNLGRNRMVSSSRESFINSMARGANYCSVSDPVRLMRIITENAQNQQKSSKPSTADIQPVVPRVPSTSDDTGNAATAAACSWMPIGAGGFKQENTTTHKNQTSFDSPNNQNHNPNQQVSRFSREIPVVHRQCQPDMNCFPLHGFVPPHSRTGNETQLQNPQTQQKQKHESLIPPDLNIGFPPSESPVQQSSGVNVDSQQPDLTLQL